jgi:hypothetical protein
VPDASGPACFPKTLIFKNLFYGGGSSFSPLSGAVLAKPAPKTFILTRFALAVNTRPKLFFEAFLQPGF